MRVFGEQSGKLLDEFIEKDVPALNRHLSEMKANLAEAMKFQTPPSREDLESLEAFARFLSRGQGGSHPLSEVLQRFRIGQRGMLELIRPRDASRDVLLGVDSWDMTKLKAPALVITANPSWLGGPREGEGFRTAESKNARTRERMKTLRAVAGIRVIEVERANHYIFISDEELVLREMKQFLAALKH